MPKVSVSVGHVGRMSRPFWRLPSVRFDSDCISSLSLLILSLQERRKGKGDRKSKDGNKGSERELSYTAKAGNETV